MIRNGGTLELYMGAEPSRSWGIKKEDWPR
jgi:hypothetical protein